MEFRFTVPRLPDGIAATQEEIERILLQQVEETSGASGQALWDLAVFYSRTGRQAEAADCIGRLRALARDSEEHAKCQLAMGRLQEQLGLFEGAAGYYRSAFELPAGTTDTWYWLNNNLGYVLIQIGRPAEAVAHLETAIEIDGMRPNAYRNLGLARGLLGEHAIAAEYFVMATQVNASDGRSLELLDQLIAAHPEVLVQVPSLGERIKECRKAVAYAASQRPDLTAHWAKLRGNRPN